MTTTKDWLLIEDAGPVRWFTFNRPERKNAIPYTGWEELGSALADFEDSSQRVLVITGAGGAFCSGADLDFGGSDGPSGIVERQRRMKQVGEVAAALYRLGKPTIAAVDGVATGAGMNLALGCDVMIASTRARFAEIFVRRGLTIDFGGTWLLPRIVGLQRAKEIALSGRMVDAEEAARIGLCLEVTEPHLLTSRATEVADSLLQGAPLAQMFAKQGINRAWEVSFEEALEWEGQSQSICFATEDVAEGIAAFFGKRPPEWKGR